MMVSAQLEQTSSFTYSLIQLFDCSHNWPILTDYQVLCTVLVIGGIAEHALFSSQVTVFCGEGCRPIIPSPDNTSLLTVKDPEESTKPNPSNCIQLESFAN